jgi:predicted dehydrogenase
MEPVGICSAQRARAEAAAERFGVNFVTDDYRELVCRPDIDLIDIVTPPRSHRDIALAAFGEGKHVLCEKPLAFNASAASEMLDTARASGLLHFVNHEKRYDPVWRHMRDVVHEGYLGRVQLVTVTVHINHGRDPGQEPFYYGWAVLSEPGGGFVMAALSHHVDLIRFCFGDISDVTCQRTTMVTQRPVLTFAYRDGDQIGADTPTAGLRPVDAEDTVVFHAKIGDGALLSMSGGWSLHHPSGIRLEAHGDEGSLLLEPDGTLLGGRADDTCLKPIPIPASLDLPEIRGAYQLVPNFVALADEIGRVIRGEMDRPDVVPTFADGYQTMLVMDALRDPSVVS